MAVSATHAIAVAKLNPSSAGRGGFALPRTSRAAALHAALAALVGLMAVTTVSVTIDPGPLPEVAERSAYAVLFDSEPVRVPITADWQKVDVLVPRYAVTSDVTLWRRMHVEDWDRLPADLRQAGLEAMFARFRWVLGGPSLWRVMTPAQWDLVPQPVRAAAYIRMVTAWIRWYGVGEMYGLPARLVDDTAAAIVMSESWFEHRGAFLNTDGTRDLGLAGASAYCRRVLTALHARGRVDFSMTDADYFNPWRATRALAVWLSVTLDEADGNLTLAIRAYHVGISRARRGAGRAYAAGVIRRRRRYIRLDGAPPAWSAALRLAALTMPAGRASGG
jgi:hypothetical protein